MRPAPSRLRRIVRSPALAILLVAPFFGEALSGSTPPLDLLLPWNLALMVALYGCGALICREVTRRYVLGPLGLCLLGAAYGVYEEGLVDRYWFYPTFWDDSGIGSYSVVADTNVLLAVHLTVFHAAVSIASSVVIVELLFPGRRDTAWVGRRGLAIAAVLLAVGVPFVYGEFDRGPGVATLLAAAGIGALLVLAAFGTRRLPRRTRQGSGRGLGAIAFVSITTHWVIVYSLPETGMPWPVGVALALVPIGAGAWLVRRQATGDPRGVDALRVVTGLVTFFVILDVFVGLAGRYDLIAGGLAAAYGLWRLRRRVLRRPVGHAA